MKNISLLISLFIIIILQSCSGLGKIGQEGEAAYQAGNYKLALATWEKIINTKGNNTKAPVYVGAGKSALALEDYDNARYYLEKANQSGYSSPEMYVSLAKVYKKVDNLSKEITALETYREKYPQGEDIYVISARLLETYVESENWELGKNLWTDLDMQAQGDVNNLKNYLNINKNLGKTEECNKIAKQINKIEPNSIFVLEYYADKYFWLAENMYVKEMNAYKKKRTTSQYNKLLKALEKVWPNFKKSRDLYLKLYKKDPKPEYAGYLSKIYTRYDNKEKAAYYKKRAK